MVGEGQIGGHRGRTGTDSPVYAAGVLQEMYPALVRAARMLSSDGDELDLVQDSLIEVLVRYPNFHGLTHPRAYTLVVLTRLAHARRLKRVREASIPIGAVDLLESGSSQRAIAGVADRLTIRNALMSLGRRQRTCVYLRFIAGLDDAAISELLGCSRVTVRSQVARGLRRMRTVLEEKRIEGGSQSDDVDSR